jgi:hypothetical protein
MSVLIVHFMINISEEKMSVLKNCRFCDKYF